MFKILNSKQFRKFEFKILNLFRISNFEFRIYQQGLTYFEILLVVALIASLGALSLPFMNRFLAQNYLQETTDRLVKTLRKAQNYALSGKQNSSWGVHYQSGEIILFKGSFYGENPEFDEAFDVPESLSFSGWSDVVFSKIRGQPSTVLTVTISSDIDSRIVVLNEEGIVNVE